MDKKSDMTDKERQADTVNEGNIQETGVLVGAGIAVATSWAIIGTATTILYFGHKVTEGAPQITLSGLFAICSSAAVAVGGAYALGAANRPIQDLGYKIAKKMYRIDS